MKSHSESESTQEPDAGRDRVMSSLSMSDADWRVAVLMTDTSANRTEGVVFFVRTIEGAMKVVGMWD